MTDLGQTNKQNQGRELTSAKLHAASTSIDLLLFLALVFPVGEKQFLSRRHLQWKITVIVRTTKAALDPPYAGERLAKVVQVNAFCCKLKVFRCLLSVTALTESTPSLDT